MTAAKFRDCPFCGAPIGGSNIIYMDPEGDDVPSIHQAHYVVVMCECGAGLAKDAEELTARGSARWRAELCEAWNERCE